MTHTNLPEGRAGARRSGALALTAALVVVMVVGLAVLNTSSSTASAAPAGAGSSAAAEAKASFADAISFSQAQKDGTVGKIDWGPTCNTSIGKLKYPSFFASVCYAPFHGNNGGSTAEGVTSKVIKVVYYEPEQNDPILDYVEAAVKDTATNAQNIATMQNWVQFYNHYYEMYGRKVELIPYTATGDTEDPVAARADAVTIATDIKPFAVWNGPLLTNAFADELAARHILCIDCGAGDNDAWFEQRAPYIWTLSMLPSQLIVQVTEFLKKQVAGRDASFAGDSAYTHEKRKFGMIDLVDDSDSAALLTEWQQSFKKAGIPVVEYETYANPLDLPTQAPGMIAKLKDAGVTSVIFAGDPVAPETLTTTATAEDYFPEWIITGSALTDTTAFARTYDQSQWAHAFGVSTLSARTGVTGAITLYKWYFGKNPPDLTGGAVDVPDAAFFYAVLQGMGPDVTAQNFQTAAFAGAPTPEALTQPSLSWGHHGIWPGTDYGGIDDATEIWWNPNISGADELGRDAKGLYEYVDGGERYLPGHWPTEATKAFQSAGAVALYKQAPPSERAPNYPSPAAGGGG